MNIGRRSFLGLASAGIVASAISPMSAIAAGAPTTDVTADQASNYANSAWAVTSVTIDTHRVADFTNTLIANDGTIDTPSSSGGTPSPGTQTTAAAANQKL